MCSVQKQTSGLGCDFPVVVPQPPWHRGCGSRAVLGVSGTMPETKPESAGSGPGGLWALPDGGSCACCEQPRCLATGQGLAGLLLGSSTLRPRPGGSGRAIPPTTPAPCPSSWLAGRSHGRRHLCFKHADSFLSCSFWSKCWTGLKINWRCFRGSLNWGF